MGKLIETAAKCMSPKFAKSRLMLMGESGMQVDVVADNFVIDACAKSGDVLGATCRLNHMRTNTVALGSAAYLGVIESVAKTGNPRKAEILIAKMLEAGFSASVPLAFVLLVLISAASHPGF